MLVEKRWTTKAGLEALCVLTPLGHRCGYVGVAPGSSLFRQNYETETIRGFNVHGGVTFCDTLADLTGGSDHWKKGFPTERKNDEAEVVHQATYRHRLVEYQNRS